MTILRKQSNSIGSIVIIIFIAFMVLVYGRGASFDVEAAEKRLSNETNNWRGIFAIASFIILYCLRKIKISSPNYKIPNIKLWCVYFICLLFISLFREKHLLSGIVFFLKIFINYLSIYQLVLFAYQRPVKVLHKQLTIVFFIIGIICLYIHIEQGHKLIFFPNRLYDNLNRLGGLFYYADTAIVLGLTSVLAYMLLYERFSYFYLIIAIASFILLIATDCRSVWFGVILSFIFFHLKKVSFTFLFLISITIFIAISFSNLIFGNFTNIAESNSDIFVRLAIWNFDLQFITASPIVGYGSDLPLVKGISPIGGILDDPHNSIFGLCLQSGVIVAILYIIIFFSNIRIGTRNKNKYRFLFFFWVFIPFFWGRFYENLSGFISFTLLFSIYTLSLHPDILNNKENIRSKMKKYINKISKRKKAQLFNN